jgi:poly(3-hydroxybutyrate) depolymerase
MGIRRVRVALALLPMLIVVTAVGCTPAKPVETGIVVDGLHVSVHYVPAAPQSTARPLVLALHGLGSTGAQFEKDTGLDAFADSHGFVVAYPDAHIAPPVTPSPTLSPSPSPSPTPSPSPSPSATPSVTPSPTPSPSPSPSPSATPSVTPSPTDSPTVSPSPVQLPAGSLSQQRTQLASSFVEGVNARDTTSSLRAWNAGDCCASAAADDVTYLRHVISAVARQTKIDLRRVYVIGLSNGGMMALKAICDAPTVFAAAGSVSGPYLGTTCARPVWRHLHGAKDPIVPYGGGVPPGSTYLGVAADWCLCSFPNSTTEAARFSQLTVSVAVFANAVHSWPRLGDGAWNVDGNADLWKFVSRYHL